MKQILLIALLTGLFGTVQAQFILGGQFGFGTTQSKSHTGSTSLETDKTSTVTILPRLAYGFSDMWAGLDAGFVYSHSVRPNLPNSNTVVNTSLFKVSPFIRFIQKPVENIGIWEEAQISGAFGGSETNGSQSDKVSQVAAGIRPGVIFFAGKHLSFEASFGRFGFTSTRHTNPNNSDNYDTENYFGLDLNQTFIFGVNWAFSE